MTRHTDLAAATEGSPSSTVAGVGIIGLGTRGLDAIARNLAESTHETGLHVTAICDRNPTRVEEASSAIQGQYRQAGVDLEPRHYVTGDDLIEDPDVDLIMITSPTDTHRALAIPALSSGKRVYCDKPLAHTVDDSVAIVEAEAKFSNRLIMGFTRRYEDPWLRAYELVQEGAIGRLVMLQVRDVIPYHRYLTSWWRRREWSGGALNDKGSHLFDVFNWFTSSKAVTVSGIGGRSSLDPVEGTPMRCEDCERECPYRRREFKTGKPVASDLATHGPSWISETEERYMDDVCVYWPGSDVYHNGSIQFTYDNGVIASYFYTLFGPPSPDEETLELVGTNGRIILTRGRGSLDLLADHGRTHREIDCRGPDFNDSHYGADKALIRELRNFVEGTPPRVSAREGLEATRMVDAALQSMDQKGFLMRMEDVADVSI